MSVTEAERVRMAGQAVARRARIVWAATQTIADYGLVGASFARIAERAELPSTRVITYHFKNKQELIGEVTSTILAALGRFVSVRTRDETTARGTLLAFLRANIEFIGGHRVQTSALVAIFTNSGFPFAADARDRARAPVEAILRDGRARGEFGDFDPVVVASLAQSCLEGLPLLLETRPELDLAAYADEVGRTFDLATRRPD
ncbi:TetR/AcrR family transcriptional regulator [Streptomyces sp. NPDC002537]